MDITVVMNQVLLLFIPIAVGYAIAKLRVVDGTFAKNLSAFIFNVALPCSIVSALQFDFDRQLLIKSALLIVISVLIIAVSYVVGLITARALKMKGFSKNVAVYSIVFSNFSFMGYPMAQAFMGDKGLLYATMFSVPLYAAVQSFGFALIDSGEKMRFKKTYILNPPLIAVAVGFVMFLCGVRLGGAIDSTVRTFGAMTTPLAMVLVGLTLSLEPLSRAFKNPKFYVTALIRLVLLPLAMFYLLRLAGVDIDICRVSAICTMMPVAANIIVTSAAFGKDTADPARSVLLTTVLSAVTIPLMGILIF